MNSTWYPEIEEPIKSREKHYSLVLYILIIIIIYNWIPGKVYLQPSYWSSLSNAVIDFHWVPPILDLRFINKYIKYIYLARGDLPSFAKKTCCPMELHMSYLLFLSHPVKTTICDKQIKNLLSRCRLRCNMLTFGPRGTPIWKGRGCSSYRLGSLTDSNILVLTLYRLGAPVPAKGNFVTKWSLYYETCVSDPVCRQFW